ncbi:Oil body lipase 1 [Hibiscus trionum]|uniref:Oil body lipase 1 n=1 Tax=Hibiscus trionum TaxID=183268 RepID=A0A9W7LUK9_HIBTR|nr:Oil body lipase 1 [Hibiscus trionum]
MASTSDFPDKNAGGPATDVFRYLIVRPEKGGIWDLLSYSLWGDIDSVVKFLESSDDQGAVLAGGEAADLRWVILFSIVARKIIHFLGKPMELIGYGVDFFLNLLSQNGSIFGLFYNLLKGDVVIPKRGTETFISTIGHIDPRMDLYHGKMLVEDLHDSVSGEGITNVEFDSRATMDLCMMASKLAYENPEVVRSVVVNRWKMHFVDFYDCWDDYQKEKSTQVFLLCDKPEDANLILISFRGTELFDADDWCTDFDYSWYEIPGIGKLHMGFLEALGLGDREDIGSFHYHLQKRSTKHSFSEAAVVKSSNADPHSEQSAGISKNGILQEMVEKKTAYYTVREKLKTLFEVHKNAKYIVTGHSLGGALAILFPTVLILHEETELLQKLLGVYTFGQPRVGNRRLGSFVEAHLDQPVPKYFRVVYCNDMVPRLPCDDKTFLYKHFGVCLYYNSCYIKQRTDEEPNRNYYGIINIIPTHLNAVWELMRSLVMGYTYGPEYKEGWFCIFIRVFGLLIPGLSAHCATNYVNSVRLGKSRGIRMSSY